MKTKMGALLVALSTIALGQTDPGPRNGQPSAGDPIHKLTFSELATFNNAKTVFQEVDSVTGQLTAGSGLGPLFNMDSCAGCHAFPAVGGSSPAVNPQIAVASKAGANNTIPPFLSLNGPVREVRFVRTPSGGPDGGVHDLFTITGRSDAQGCNVAQPDFASAVANHNAVFRIPTPTFGNGLIESIDDATIMANLTANSSLKVAFGISGHENRNGNDGSLTRFGWKAQNKSLMIFAGEAYNVEQGVTNDVFPNERYSGSDCRFNPTPEDTIGLNGLRANVTTQSPSDVISFVFFMRFLDAPNRGPQSFSTLSGQVIFSAIGCALCHVPSMQTSSSATSALSNVTANLYSDLLVHNMGTGLADGITQGMANGNEFRTAPLWGLGQRLFFLHDGRANELITAIAAHASSGSEANGVIGRYNSLSTQQKQDLLNFLRSL